MSGRGGSVGSEQAETRMSSQTVVDTVAAALGDSSPLRIMPASQDQHCARTCTVDAGTQNRAPTCTVKSEYYMARTRTEFVESPGHAAPMCTALAGNRKTQYRAPRETGMCTAVTAADHYY